MEEFEELYGSISPTITSNARLIGLPHVVTSRLVKLSAKYSILDEFYLLHEVRQCYYMGRVCSELGHFLYVTITSLLQMKVDGLL